MPRRQALREEEEQDAFRRVEVRTLWLQRHITEGRVLLASRPGPQKESNIGKLMRGKRWSMFQSA
eukprot:3638273-Prorocentrum_lima.AAC.1